jgi:hypothetical protein
MGESANIKKCVELIKEMDAEDRDAVIEQLSIVCANNMSKNARQRAKHPDLWAGIRHYVGQRSVFGKSAA